MSQNAETDDDAYLNCFDPRYRHYAWTGSDTFYPPDKPQDNYDYIQDQKVNLFDDMKSDRHSAAQRNEQWKFDRRPRPGESNRAGAETETVASDYKPSYSQHPLVFSPYSTLQTAGASDDRLNRNNPEDYRGDTRAEPYKTNMYSKRELVKTPPASRQRDLDTSQQNDLPYFDRQRPHVNFASSSEQRGRLRDLDVNQSLLANDSNRYVAAPKFANMPLHVMTDSLLIEPPNNTYFNPMFPFSNQSITPKSSNEMQNSVSGERGIEKAVTFSNDPGLDPDKTDQHLSNLFTEIYTIRSEAETVQYKYRREREAWSFQNAALQAKVIELSSRLKEKSEMLADVHLQYSHEVKQLKEENRDLFERMSKESIHSESRITSDKHEKKMDDLILELYSLKRDLEMLRNRYEDEKQIWAEKNEKLEDQVKGHSGHRKADEEELAHASLNYRLSERNVKKEKEVLEMELDDEKRRTRAMEIEIEVLRDQLIKVQNKKAGISDGVEDGVTALHADTLGAGSGLGSGGRNVLDGSKDPYNEGGTKGGYSEGGTKGGYSEEGPKGLSEQQEKNIQVAEKILKMEERMHEKNVELTNKQEEITKLSEEKDKAEKELKELREKKDSSYTKLNTVRQEAKEAQEAKEVLGNENERLKEESGRRQEEIKRLRDELQRAAEAEKERDKLMAESKELRDKSNWERDELEKELEKERTERRRLEEKLRNIKNKLEDGKRNYKNFQGDIENLNKLIE